MMKTKIFLFFFILLSISTEPGFASKVWIRVLERGSNEPLIGYAIEMRKVKDSDWRRIGYTGMDGFFVYEDEPQAGNPPIECEFRVNDIRLVSYTKPYLAFFNDDPRFIIPIEFHVELKYPYTLKGTAKTPQVIIPFRPDATDNFNQ